ncbi:hypothetical protein BKA63DRAFT_88466 [Paraphoma chrysanthemicola]|nr:hypothetical protein BKA63DRAFT_88466 [Paraphoma chrysanthemicola]
MVRVFRWIAGARRPLTIVELEEAVTIEPSDTFLHSSRSLANAGERLVAYCGNLVIYDEIDNTVQFAHHTVHQFVLSVQGFGTINDQMHLDIFGINHFIGEICLTYLSFTDFETQLTTSTEVTTFDQEQAVQIVWNNVPFSRFLRSMLLASQGWRTSSERTPDHIRLSLPTFAQPTDYLTRKYAMLDYIVAHWPFHTAHLDESSPTWSRFKHIVLHQQLHFNIHPWLEQQHTSHVNRVKGLITQARKTSGQRLDRTSRSWESCWAEDHFLIYSWAMTHGSSSLLSIFKEGFPEAYPESLRHEDLVGRHTSGRFHISVLRERLRVLVKEAKKRPTTAFSPQGFWTGDLLVAISLEAQYEHPRATQNVQTADWELQRWVEASDLLRNHLFQRAIFLTLQINDTRTFGILVDYYVCDWSQYTQLLVATIREGHVEEKIMSVLLRVEIPHVLCSPSDHWEMFYALYYLLSEHSFVFQKTEIPPGEMSGLIKSILLTLLLVYWGRPLQLRPFLDPEAPEDWHWLPSSDPAGFTRTAFGTAELHQRILGYTDMALSSTAEYISLIAEKLLRLADICNLPQPQPEVSTMVETVRLLLSHSKSLFQAEAFENDGIHGLLWAVHANSHGLVESLLPYYHDWISDDENMPHSVDIIVASGSLELDSEVLTLLATLQWPPSVRSQVEARLRDTTANLPLLVLSGDKDAWLNLLALR